MAFASSLLGRDSTQSLRSSQTLSFIRPNLRRSRLRRLSDPWDNLKLLLLPSSSPSGLPGTRDILDEDGIVCGAASDTGQESAYTTA